ncbi:MAG: deoxyribonuclease IV [Acidobacteriota bacterium]|nr:deoxyribonuclease IV [Acidobacteriota bacterium]MDH3785861.1 deoxyribonuclease IV [Acidobacteriota bacterium]
MAVKRARLGSHMSIAGGIPLALERADRVDSTALQVFVKSARQWTPKPLPEDDIKAFRQGLEARGLGPYVIAHATYLINLASPDEAMRKRSIDALAQEIERCELLGIPGLVLHPGSHMKDGEEVGLERVARSLDAIFAPKRRVRKGAVRVLLENTAGQGTNLGHRFEHLQRILELAKSRERLAVCFDTCHALAAGYDVATPSGYKATMKEVESTFGTENIRAFHLNDSKHELGSRRDRHEHIGDGHVGIEGFRALLNDRRFHDVPMVLETAKDEDLEDDRRNLARLRALLPKSRR